jgi:hypothetical protein
MQAYDLLERFSAQARDFERTFIDDDWSRLAPYFAVDAVYETLGYGGQRFVGRPALLSALRRAVNGFDRRCDSRTLITTDGPFLAANEVRKDWSCTFTLSGAPDLIIEGHERAVYRGALIELLQERLAPASRADLNAWLQAHGARLARRRGG